MLLMDMMLAKHMVKRMTCLQHKEDLEVPKSLEAVRPGTVLSPAEELKKEFPGITDDMIKTILIDDNPQRIAEVKQTMREALTMIDKGMGMDEIMDILAKTKKNETSNRRQGSSGKRRAS